MKKRSSRARRRTTASASLGCLFWAALVLVLAAVALAVRQPLTATIRGLIEQRRAASAPAATPAPASALPETRTPARPVPQPSVAPSSVAPAAEPATSPAAATSSAAGSSATSAAAASARPAPKPPTRSARLYFVKVSQNGEVSLAAVNRTVAAGDSPLRDALASLIEGPSPAEAGQGLMTMVPAATTLRSVSVRDGTATIDFGSGFRHNASGREGLEAQLRQVVWVATEFPTVQRVQLLIDGERVPYLGPEGLAIGAPLTRESFSQ